VWCDEGGGVGGGGLWKRWVGLHRNALPHPMGSVCGGAAPGLTQELFRRARLPLDQACWQVGSGMPMSVFVPHACGRTHECMWMHAGTGMPLRPAPPGMHIPSLPSPPFCFP
jgi:hypothetical protein